MNWICWTNVSSDKLLVLAGLNAVHLHDNEVPVALMILKHSRRNGSCVKGNKKTGTLSDFCK